MTTQTLSPNGLSQLSPWDEDALIPSEIVTLVEAYLRRQKPVMLWGDPGIGKSDIIRQIAVNLGWDIVETRAVLYEPSELRFSMVPRGGKLVFDTPPIFRATKPTIWFLDELNRAPELVLNALLQPVLDRRMGEHVLPDCVSIVSACNYSGPGVRQMGAAMTSRFGHFDMRVSLDDWTTWAFDNGLEPLLVAFLRFRRELLHKYDPKARSFPCPRTWAGVDGVLKEHLSPRGEFAGIMGYVGRGAATECEAFLSMYRDLPSIDGIILDPDGSPVPPETQTIWAVACALSMSATAANFGRIIRYLERLDEEYNVFAVRAATSRDKSLEMEPDYTQWFIRHPSI